MKVLFVSEGFVDNLTVKVRGHGLCDWVHTGLGSLDLIIIRGITKTIHTRVLVCAKLLTRVT